MLYRIEIRFISDCDRSGAGIVAFTNKKWQRRSASRSVNQIVGEANHTTLFADIWTFKHKHQLLTLR